MSDILDFTDFSFSVFANEKVSWAEGNISKNGLEVVTLHPIDWHFGQEAVLFELASKSAKNWFALATCRAVLVCQLENTLRRCLIVNEVILKLVAAYFSDERDSRTDKSLECVAQLILQKNVNHFR